MLILDGQGMWTIMMVLFLQKPNQQYTKGVGVVISSAPTHSSPWVSARGPGVSRPAPGTLVRSDCSVCQYKPLLSFLPRATVIATGVAQLEQNSQTLCYDWGKKFSLVLVHEVCG